MANFNDLKTAIQQVVKTNGNKEITGALLQQSLLSMINSLGAEYQFIGVATPSTNPGTPDQKVFYIATQAGVYPNFGDINILQNETAIIKGTGSSWVKETTDIANYDSICPYLNMSSELSLMLKELYLTGLGESEYRIASYGTYINEGGLAQTILIEEVGGGYVAQCDTTKTENGINYVRELNNSGITGYAIFDLFSMNEIVWKPDKNYIKKDIVSVIYNSPSIFSFENKGIKDVVSVKDIVPYDISYPILSYNPDQRYFTCGYDKPAVQPYLIREIEISVNEAAHSINDNIDIYIGFIDQRGWFILDKKIIGTITAKIQEYITIKVTGNEIVPLGCIVVVNCGVQWGFEIAHVQEVYAEYNRFIHIDPSNLPTGVTFRTDVTLARFIVRGVEINSIFATSEDLSIVKKKVDKNSLLIEQKDFFTDEITHYKYKIVVSNGEIVLRRWFLNKALFLGNSFTEHGIVQDIWWSDGRGMAASVNIAQYTSQIAVASGAEITKGNYAGFETGYSPTYDFETYIPISDSDYDLVVVQLFENATYGATMQQSWEALYDYIRLKCPNAQIVQIIGWYNTDKYNAVSAAASSRGVILLDCSDVAQIGKYQSGDYVTDDNNQYHAITNSGVLVHPSDVGFNGIANKILELYGIELNNTHNIAIVQESAAQISIPNPYWVYGGIVNVRVVSGTVNNIVVSGASGNIQVTQRDSTHYTFVMPNEDVTITVS